MNTSVQSDVPTVLGNPINAIDMANYIIWQIQKRKLSVTHLKLQKLLYYVLAKYVKNYGKLLVDENIYKWQYGPVVKSVYHQFKVYGHSEIQKPMDYVVSVQQTMDQAFQVTFAYANDINSAIQNNHPDITETTEQVLLTLATKTPFDLVMKTHKENAWRQYESDILRGVDIHYTLEELMQADI